jgi:hypothetical protein
VKPAFATCVVAPAVDVFVQDMRVVPPETRNFLLQTMLCVLHERGVATMPALAVPLDRSVYAVAHGLDRILLYHFAVKWWEFLMPVHDLGPSVSR